MVEETNTIQQDSGVKVVKKRGRKPKSKGYFVEEQEAAFLRFLQCEDEYEKNKIFSKEIYPPLCKMVECLIRRYELYVVGESYEDTFYKTLGFLMTKIKNFDPNRKKKAFSYCGTICKRFLILERTKSLKNRDKVLSYESTFPSSEKDCRIDEEPRDETFYPKLIERTKNDIQEILDKGATDKRPLKETEIKIGQALIEILEHWEEMTDDESSRKFRKASLLYFIKEYTLCDDTAAIRNAMKIFKKAYLFTKEKLLKE